MIRNKIIRNLVKLLLIVLIVVFIFMNLGDVFKTKKESYVIKIADVEYSYQQWHEIVNNNIRETKIKYGKELSTEEINSLKQYLVNQLIESTLLYIEAKNLGITVNSSIVKKVILKIPAFSKGGKFNKDLFDKTIQSYGLSEEAFIDKIKEELTRNIFINSIINNKIVIPELIKIILQDILENRKMNIIKIPFAAFKISSIPDKNALKVIYEKNKSNFKISEKRNISYIIISLDAVKNKDQKVDEKKLYKIYKEKSFLLIEPEKRIVEQIQFNSLNNAKKAKEELLNGADFKSIAKKFSPDFKKINLGIITFKDFEEEISTKLFKLNKGEITDIIETPLGLYIFKISNIIHPKKKDYNDVKELILKESLKEINFNKFFALIKDIQGELKEGKSIESIAKTHHLNMKQIEISNTLINNNNISSNKIFIKNVFKTQLNAQSPLFRIGSEKFCAFKVTKITMEQIQDFEEVQNEVKKIWHDNEIIKKANQLSFDSDTLYKLQMNNNLIDFQNIKIINISVARDAIIKNIPTDFLQQVFDLLVNKFTKPYINKLNKEVLIAKLVKINLPSLDKIYKYKDLYEAQIQRIEQEVIITELLEKLRKRYDIKINQNLIWN